jgi:chemotaxis protein histidine kinase CheA/ActR/RegA family two-component response regulator
MNDLFQVFLADFDRQLSALEKRQNRRHAAGDLFELRTAAALLGIDAVERAAAAGERALLDDSEWDLLADLAKALRDAWKTLSHGDASGARLDDPSALEKSSAALEKLRPPKEEEKPVEPPKSEDDAAWRPQVDADMIEPFLDEAGERLEALSQKLLQLESAPGDAELVRDVFRDLHTLKGSSGFVGLKLMNRLAHAAEDLVGQLRDGSRRVDRPVIDALLGALDGLRAISDAAAKAAPQLQRGEAVRVEVAIEPIVERLRAPAIAAAKEAPPPAQQQHAQHEPAHESRHTLRVDFDKLDALLNLVGELILTKGRLHASTASLGAFERELEHELKRARGRKRLEFDDLDRFARVFAALASDFSDGTGALDRVANELRQQVMKLRMLPIARVFTKYGRVVRELAHGLGKEVRLELEGQETELDKVLVEQLDDPLLHLVRNAVDHGVEMPDSRGDKPREGVVKLSARHQGNQIIIEVQDDGAGIEPDKLRKKALEKNLANPDELAAMDERQVLDLIFRPGFSTAARVTDLSGRGVGMDVVRATVTKLGGSIEIASRPGQGTTFTLKLPLTLAILPVLMVRAAGEELALPLDAVVRSLHVKREELAQLYDRNLLFHDGEQIPVVWLANALELEGMQVEAEAMPLLLVRVDGELYGIVVERLLGKREAVQKTLGELLAEVPCVGGATLIDDRVALVLDVAQVVQRGLQRPATRPSPAKTSVTAGLETRGTHKRRVLVAEDSEVIRETLRRLFETHGCEVVAARDGAEALELAERDALGFDLVSTDVVMPRVDGYELTKALRAHPRHRDVPIVMVTSRSAEIDRVRGFDAGVDDYLTKPLDGGELLRTMDHLIGRHKRRV